jgi:hypothetical protein
VSGNGMSVSNRSEILLSKCIRTVKTEIVYILEHFTGECVFKAGLDTPGGIVQFLITLKWKKGLTENMCVERKIYVLYYKVC